MIKNDMELRAERRRQALIQQLDKHGLTPTEVARQAGLKSPNAIYNFLQGRSHAMSQLTYEKLAEVIPGSSIDLLAGTDVEQTEVASVLVRTYTRLGEWRQQFDLPMKKQWEVPVALEARDMTVQPFGVEVGRPGAENIYSEGTILVVAPIKHSLKHARPGVRAIVQKMIEGKMEVSVQEIQVVDDKAWLLPQTILPRYQNPTSLPWPYNGRMWRQGDMRLTIAGLVIMHTAREVVL